VDTSRHYQSEPLDQLADERLDLLLNLSASPWSYGKDSSRRQIVQAAAARVGAPIVYVNAVGGNDELIFDGHSLVMSPDGTLHGGLAPFREDCRVVDLAGAPQVDEEFDRPEMADVWDALVLGLRDYTRKTGFTKAVLGLSGGIDSAL